MKFKKSIILCLAALAVALICVGCTSDFYKDYDKRGYSVGVRYDANGGQFAGTSDRNVVDLFPTSAVLGGGVKLLEPGDSKRGNDTVIERSTATYTGYFLAGWYRERTMRVDENGNPLDENGVLTSVSGKAQGYSYSGKWDFENDKLTIEQGKTYKASEVVLTLYAAWVPYFTFDFYAKENGEWERITYAEFNPLTKSGELMATVEVQVPTWSDETGAMNYGTFKTEAIDNKTFDAVYADEGMTEKLEGTLARDVVVDYEHGVAVTSQKYYSTWQDGIWYHIKTAAQLNKSVDSSGCYIIEDDLDFSDVAWPEGFARGDFTGKMIGSDGTTRTISNITVRQTDSRDQMYGGIFGRVLDSAELDHISFTNVTYSFEMGTTKQGTSFGLFTGVLSEKAKITDVHVDGTFRVGEVCALYSASSDRSYYDGYVVGLLCGNDLEKPANIDYDITCESMAVKIGTADPTYPCLVEVVDGKVHISLNPDPTTNPNS